MSKRFQNRDFFFKLLKKLKKSKVSDFGSFPIYNPHKDREEQVKTFSRAREELAKVQFVARVVGANCDGQVTHRPCQ